MKKVTLLCGLLLAISATLASAAPGTNLRWGACLGDLGTPNKASACSNNLGQSVLVGSFELPADLPGVTGVEIVVDIATAGATLPPWWQISNATDCRGGVTPALSMNGTISASAANCFDWAANQAAGGLAAYNIGANGPNTARIVAGFAVAAAKAQNLFGGIEYFSFNAVITNAKTSGAGSCAGCSVPACLIYNSVKVATPPVVGQPSRDVSLSGPTNGTDSNYCTWQGGVGVVVGSKQGCPAAVPTHNSTWTQVKSLYR